MVDWGSALLVAVLGMAIVFLVLSLIMLVLVCMEKIFAPKKKETAVKTETKVQSDADIKTEEKTPVVEFKSDDSELIAVITAAIAASLNTNACNLKIRSYRKLGQNAWGNASRKENIYSRF